MKSTVSDCELLHLKASLCVSGILNFLCVLHGALPFSSLLSFGLQSVMLMRLKTLGLFNKIVHCKHRVPGQFCPVTNPIKSLAVMTKREKPLLLWVISSWTESRKNQERMKSQVQLYFIAQRWFYRQLQCNMSNAIPILLKPADCSF